MSRDTVYVVALGDAFSGMSLFGPFDEAADAELWVEDFRLAGNTKPAQVVAVLVPEELVQSHRG